MQSKLPLILILLLAVAVLGLFAWDKLTEQGCNNISAMNCGGYGSAYTGR